MAPPSSRKRKYKSESKQHGKLLKKTDKTGEKHTSELSLHGEDDDFPRGGGSLLNKEERAKAMEAGGSEMPHGALKRRKKEKKQRSRNMSADNDVGSLFGDGICGKFPRFANRITLKNVSSGMKLWGTISEVNEKDIVVSLPGGLRGIVRASDAVDNFMDDALKENVGSGFLSKIYKEGQLVPCVVLNVDDDRMDSTKLKIWLSLRLSLLYKSLRLDGVQEGMVLNAYIKSIEDHGFILHFGLSSFTGFMPIHGLSDRRNAESCVREILQGVVISVDRAQKVVHLSSDPGAIMKSVTRELSGISIDTLIPGMMVNARVISVLETGIMLSFLSYFTGTVDIFNLNNTFPPSSWKNDYSKNMKVNARILFIDPSTRAVGLTMNPYLVGNKAPQCLVKIGDIFDQAKVVRVDKAFGLLVELPTVPCKTPAFVSAADVSDKSAANWDKNYREGSVTRIRLLGYRHLEGLAIGALKASALEGLVISHADMKPGMVVKGKIAAVRPHDAIVQIASGVKAICPLRHMSELEIVKPPKKFQVGVELVFRVLGCKSKRITVTHKRTLVKSKLNILSSYADATDGLVTHGWITKIENRGCFVHFYNGVEGYAPRSELGLEPGNDIGSKYHAEQVVKCRVIKDLATSRRIGLSFNITQSREPLIESLKPGFVVSGVCEYVTSQAVSVSIDFPSQPRGTITIEHLSDHHGLATLLMSAMKPGYHFDQLLVLDVKGSTVVLSTKYSLIRSSKQLPTEISDINLHSVMPGYICNIIEAGCFVRFLGNLTGFVPKSKATDARSSNLFEIFYVGQSVRCNAVDVNTEAGRITLSLKQSLCCSVDTSFIQEYFLLEEKIAHMQAVDAKSSGLSWSEDFGLGCITEGRVHEIKDVGAVIIFEKYSDVYGFISHNQMTEVTLEVNSVIEAAVLDVSKIDRLVDLSLKPDLISGCKEESHQRTPKKRKKEASRDLEVNQIVNAVVEIVKENYLVLSLPNRKPAIGYLSRSDYNTQKLPPKQFSYGQRVSVRVMSLPAPSTGGRLLLLLNCMDDDMENSSLKRARKKNCYDVGSIVQAEITEIKPLEARVKFGPKQRGRIHITETISENSCESPFSTYKVGQTVRAVIVSSGNKPQEGRGGCQWELSVKPCLLEGSLINERLTKYPEDMEYTYGQHVTCFVYKIDREWVWLAISRDVSAKLHLLDSSCEPAELEEFQSRFTVGKAVYAYIVNVNKEKKLLRVSLSKPVVKPAKFSQDDLFYHIDEGDVIGGRISKILPGVGGVLVQVGPHHYGKVHFMELADSWVSDPLSRYQEGQFVKCTVLEVYCSAKGTVHVDLSLRSTLGSSNEVESADQSSGMMIGRVMDVKDLHPNMVVKGYVKNISNKGCFIMLSRKLDAKILISNLSDNYVEHPEKEFPVGTLVKGRVLSVETLSKRVEVTLKTSVGVSAQGSNADSFDDVPIGSVVSGRIKRIEAYGLFISIDCKNAVGLCHISEISDCQREDLDAKYAVGQKVSVKILKVDKDRNRVSLGMKSSYLMNEEELSISEQQIVDTSFNKRDSVASAELVLEEDHSVSCIGNSCHDIPPDTESRALVPPLEVPLDDVEGLASEGVPDQKDSVISASTDKKTPESGKKRARSQREAEIRAAEERLREDGIPRNADEFEKLIRSSPNSSFIWIKYMEFMLSLADYDKARSIAERALQTINMREESEKLNIWVAYFNLENEFGSPPEEAVKKIFQRALQSCDPKKLHLALLGLYEATKQYTLASCLLDKMTKNFKHSCKVWLRKVEYLLKTNSDEIELVVKRTLQCLPQRKHIKFSSQTAIREFKLGVPDRGRSMFENILKNHSKRTDIWSVYLDQEIHLGDQDVIRTLFERATSLNLPSKTMMPLFKKYLKYEQSVGDEERAEFVKKKAMEYAEA